MVFSLQLGDVLLFLGRDSRSLAVVDLRLFDPVTHCLRTQAVELATARWADWYNNRRLHSSIGDVPPAEFEATYYANSTTVDAA